MNILLLSIAAGVVALGFAAILTSRILKSDEGSDEVRFIGNAIREGAMAFLAREYRMLAVFVFGVFIVLAVFIDYDVLDKMERDAAGVPATALSYLAGAIGSGLAGFIGMSIAVRANTRTTVQAQRGLNSALRVAFNSGSVMGVSVVGIGLIGITAVYLIFQDITVVAGFGFGASSIALFARVGGGIYTKAADVGADLVGKIEQGLDEDDPRNPATVADNVGDNVGDVAGMGADLFESYTGSIIATIALGVAGVAALGVAKPGTFDAEILVLPMLIATIGIFASIIGTFLVRTREGASMGSLLWSLRFGIFGAGILVLVGTAVALIVLEMDFNLFWVVLAGLVAGQIIGTASEIYTSYEYKFTRDIADQALTGPATVIISGAGAGNGKHPDTGGCCRCGDVDRERPGRHLRRRAGRGRNAVHAGDHAGHRCVRPGRRQRGRHRRAGWSRPFGTRADGRSRFPRQHDGSHWQGICDRIGCVDGIGSDGGVLRGNRC